MLIYEKAVIKGTVSKNTNDEKKLLYYFIQK
jgi:hypothetical protein